MQKKRALVTTALLTTAVGLLGCSVSTGDGLSGQNFQLPAYQQSLVSQANRQAVQISAQGNTPLPSNSQVAELGVLQTGTRTDVPSGILQPGSIILRRSVALEKPVPAEELAATMRRIATEVSSQQLADEKPIILAAADRKIAATASELSRQSSQDLKESEGRLQAFSTQQSEAVASAVKAYAQQNTAATADELRAYAEQIARQTVTQASPEVQQAVRTMANQAILQKDQAVEFAINKMVEDRLTSATQDPVAVAIKSLAQGVAAEQNAQTATKLQANLTEAEKRQKDFVVNELAYREQTANGKLQSTEAQLALLATQTAQAIESLKQQQQTLTQSSKDYARAEAMAAQLAAQQTSIQQAQEATRQAQAAALQAEAHAKEYAVEKLAAASTENKLTAQQTEAKIAAMGAENKLTAKETEAKILAAAAENKLTAQQTEAKILASTAENKLTAKETEAKIAAAAAEHQLSAQATANELKGIREAQNRQQELFQNTITQVAKELKTYGDTQLTSLAHETRNSISQTAAVAQQSTEQLTGQTAAQLSRLRAEAANRNELLATRLTNQFAENIQGLAAETEAKRLTPEQVSNAASAAAETAVTNATPQFRALALQTLADSQDYIRTVAQESLTDGKDPAVQEALEKAAKTVITKDDQVVFAIRDALTPKPTAPKLPEGERTVLGNGERPDTITADTNIDATRLGVAALAGGLANIAPSSGGSPGHLAALNPLGERSLGTPRNRQDWIDLRKYRVVVHEDGATLEKLMSRLMAEAVPYTGPWQVKWKLSEENKDLAQEIFSLDAETTFEDFVTYLSQYVQNARGVKLSFNLFDAEHILVISD